MKTRLPLLLLRRAVLLRPTLRVASRVSRRDDSLALRLVRHGVWCVGGVCGVFVLGRRLRLRLDCAGRDVPGEK